MTRTVWKFPIEVADTVEIELPVGAEILHADEQQGVPMLWVLVDPLETMKQVRKLRFAGTGHHIYTKNGVQELDYVSTFLMAGGALVWHIFEVVGN